MTKGEKQMHFAEQGILVTGGAGFVGSHLVERLVRIGARVTVVDNLSSGKLDNLAECAESIDFFELDLLDSRFHTLVSKKRFDIIYHLAANAYVPPSVKDPAFDYRSNLQTTFELLECVRQNRLNPVFIYASSAAVYGAPSKMPIQETDLCVPISPYGVSKLASERYMAVYSRCYGLRGASVRFFSLYGPRQQKQVVFDFIKKLHQDPTRLMMLGDGSQIRDLLFVKDAVEALLRVTYRGKLEGEVYNVASGQTYTTRDLARAIESILGIQPAHEFSGSVRLGDPDRWEADISHLESLGWQPEISLESGLTRTVEWYQRVNKRQPQRQELGG